MKTWFLGLRERLWQSLEGKGKYTSFMGLIIVVASVYKPLVEHNKGVTFAEGYMFQTLYFVAIGIVLIILPSYMKISKDGIEIKD